MQINGGTGVAMDSNLLTIFLKSLLAGTIANNDTGRQTGFQVADAYLLLQSILDDDNDLPFLEMTDTRIAIEVNNVTDGKTTRYFISKDELTIKHTDSSSFLQHKIDNSGLEIKTQDDEVSPTIQTIISASQTEINLVSQDVPTPNAGNITIQKTAIDLAVTDGTDHNAIHADKENFSIAGTSGIPFDFYNSENRLYMSLHLMNFGGLGNYATNAAAITAGLQVGDIYRTAGVLMIVI